MTDVQDLIKRQPSGSVLDHIAIGGSDFDALCDEFEARTGVTPHRIADEVADTGTRSAVVPLGDGTSSIELLAPDPRHPDTRHPVVPVLRALAEPRALFWYIGVTDLAELEVQAKAQELPFIIQSAESPDGAYAFARAFFGMPSADAPDYATPFLIEWLKRPEREPGWLPESATGVTLRELALERPAEGVADRVAAWLGHGLSIGDGATSRAVLHLATPKGDVVF